MRHQYGSMDWAALKNQYEGVVIHEKYIYIGQLIFLITLPYVVG